MPYYESTSEEAERLAQEGLVRPLEVLISRSVLLRELNRELGVIHGLVKNSKRKDALAKIEGLMSRINP